MLILSRKVNESILIGDEVEITVTQVRGTGDQAVVRLGIKAPRDVVVLRREVYDEIVAATRQAAQAGAAADLARALLAGEEAPPAPGEAGAEEDAGSGGSGSSEGAG